jgi:5'-methylthioadenosine phosphorylase
MILTNLRKGIDAVRRILKLLLPSIPQQQNCGCASALEYAIATEKKYIPKEKKKELDLLIGKYLGERKDVNQD